MGIEIERKFLVYPERLVGLLEDGTRLVQGYLAYEPAVRIRIEEPATGDPVALLTIKLKGKSKGVLARPEFNFEIPLQDGLDLANECTGEQLIDKTRFRLGRWEIDQFHKGLNGLWLAEIELESEDEPVEIPSWVRREVTEDPRYSNANLIRFGVPSDYGT